MSAAPSKKPAEEKEVPVTRIGKSLAILSSLRENYKIFIDFYTKVMKSERVHNFVRMLDYLDDALKTYNVLKDLPSGPEKIEVFSAMITKMGYAEIIIKTQTPESLRKLLPLPSPNFKMIRQNPEVLATLQKAQGDVVILFAQLKKVGSWDIATKNLIPEHHQALEEWAQQFLKT